MKLKTKYRYGNRWCIDEHYRLPLASTSFDIYEGFEDPGDDTHVLTYRPVILKSLHYQPGTSRDDALRRRQAFAQQLSVLALGHFMLPEPYDYCLVTDHHSPVVAGSDLADSEPLLVYSYSPGETLRAHVGGTTVQPGRFLPSLEALDIIRRIASFLSFLHSAGYGHIAVNPDHFLYHAGSLRVLGFSKIVPLQALGAQLVPQELPFFNVMERSFLPGEALMNASFSLGSECYGLGMLLYYLLSGRCPSTILRQPTDRLPWAEIDQLNVCREVKLFIAELTSWPHEYTVAQLDQIYSQQLDRVFDAQKEFEEDQLLTTKQIGIFVDLENIVASFTARGTKPEMPLDLEAVAAAHARQGPTYKCVVVPRHRTRGRVQGPIAQLMRAGWHVRLVDPLMSDDGYAIMGEVDDSYLIQAGNRFLEQADAQQLIVISNDSDYKLLLEKARFKGCATHIVYGYLRGATRASISHGYLRDLDQLGVTAHLLHSYPFVFERETSTLCKKIRQSLSGSHAYPFKMLIWELVQQLGYERALALFSTEQQGPVPGKKILHTLKDYEVAYYPTLIQMLSHSQRLGEDVERLGKRQKQLTRFSPYRPDILMALFQLPPNREPLLQWLSEAPDIVAAEWDFVKAHLNDEPLLRLFLRAGRANQNLCNVIKADPGAIQALIRKHHEPNLLWVMETFGADALPLLERFDQPGLWILRKYQQQGFHALTGPSSDILLSLETNAQNRTLLEEWYQQHKNLDIIELLHAEPRLTQLGHQAGVFAVEIYRREHKIEPVLQATRIAALTFHPLEAAYNLWCQLHAEHFQVDDSIRRLEMIQRLSAHVFRGRQLSSEEYTNLVKSLFRAVDENVINALVNQYVVLGSPIIDTYRQFGPTLFALIDRTHPDVVNVLQAFPELFPDLQTYGRAAYDFIRNYRDDAPATLMRLRHQDLSILLTSPALLSILKDWHMAHQNLRAVDFLVAEPQLIKWTQDYGVGALELYAEDQDLAVLQQTIHALPDTGLPLYETYALFQAAKDIPKETVLNLIADYRPLFLAQADTPSRVRWLTVFQRATEQGVADDLATLTRQVGVNAINAFDQFGAELFPVVKATQPLVVNLLMINPDIFPDLQRYGAIAYIFIRTYQDAAFKALYSLRHVDLTKWLGDTYTGQLLAAWHQEHHNLLALDLLIEQPWLLEWTRRYTELIAGDTSAGATSSAPDRLHMLRLYASDRNPGLLAASLALAEEGHLPFQESYPLLREVNKPIPVVRGIVTRYSNDLKRLPDSTTRAEFLTVLYNAHSEGLEDDIIDLFNTTGHVAIQAYHQFGADIIQLTQQLGRDILQILARHPDLFISFKRYGQVAYRFVQHYGSAGIDKLTQNTRADLSKVLSDEAQPILQDWYASHNNVDIVNLLLIDWPIMHIIKEAGNAAKIFDIWLALWHQRQIRAPSAVIEQYRAVLLNPHYDYKQLIPLVLLVEPRQLELVTSMCYPELLAYQEPAEQVCLCKVLTETLHSSEDAARYVALATAVDRSQLLALTQSSGFSVIDFLELLYPQAQASAMSRLLTLPPGEQKDYIAGFLINKDQLRGWTESVQVKAIKATERQPIEVVTQVGQDYGEAGLDEIIKSGKLGVLFKLAHLWQK